MKKVTYQEAHEPTVFITKNKQRIKQYDNTVYLNNGDEFELELFNPLTEKVLAKIKINNKYIDDAGIIIRPGERVFLERYLNEARKFVFSIYEVESNSPVVQKAIEDNGDVVVEFHKEQFNQPIIWSTNTVYYNTNPNPSDFYYNGTLNLNNSGTTYSNSGAHNTLTSGALFSAGLDFSSEVKSSHTQPTKKMESVKMEETGRVEKGSQSDQQFVYEDTKFEYYSTWTKTWKILPASKKPIFKEEIKVYCTNCGTRRKKSSFKFCPNCGAKF